MKPLWHFVKRKDRLLQAVKLLYSDFSRKQFIGYVLKNGAQVRGRLSGR